MVMRLTVAGVLGALFMLAGCESATRYPIACPRPGILGEAADLTRYRDGAVPDLTALESDARLVRVEGGCTRANGAILVRMAVGFVVDRGPAARSREVELPWFVAVIDNRTNQVLTERDFRDGVVFNPNETRVSGMSREVEMTLPVSEQRRANDYSVLVAFRLSPEQLAMTRRRGSR